MNDNDPIAGAASKNPGADTNTVTWPWARFYLTPGTGSAATPTDEAAGAVQRAVEHWGRYSRQQDERLRNAEKAGAELAAVVQRFLADPVAVGTDALYTAYGKYMSQHAGNFGPSTQ